MNLTAENVATTISGMPISDKEKRDMQKRYRANDPDAIRAVELRRRILFFCAQQASAAMKKRQGKLR